MRNEYFIYVDDDPDDIELLRTSFEKADPSVSVVAVKDGAELIGYLDDLTYEDPLPQLIILDINMPKMTGEEALPWLKSNEQYQNIPVVLFSSTSNFPNPQFLRKWKTAFIHKPGSLEEWRIIALRLLEFSNHMKPLM
jgi:CheY-like chemotaxis protein